MTATALQPVVGLEVHAQLLTRSKMFCSCSARYSGAPPNTHTCAVCAGMPGSLPVINATALEFGIRTVLALNCEVAGQSKFDRKNYSYPDVPKGYQISQYDEPIGKNGWLEFRVSDRVERWGITRIHLEEDTGKTFHTELDGREVSLVDYNRSGVPLMEIVTDPESRTPEEAREFFAALRQVLMYLEVCDGNLQEGSMRADVNVSLRGPDGEPGTKVEIKNLNSFRAVQRALEYEIERQAQALRSGGTIEQETRGWVEREEITIGQRTKEYAHDYRYFPEPDLPPLIILPEGLERIGAGVPELPVARAARLEREYGITPAHAAMLTAERPLAEYFERATAASTAAASTLANWITGDLVRLLRDSASDLAATPVTAERLGALVDLVDRGEISGAAGKQVLDVMQATGEEPGQIVERLGLRQVSDVAQLEDMIDTVLAANPRLVETFRRGKTNVIQAMVGQVMKASRGKANPELVRELLEQRLA